MVTRKEQIERELRGEPTGFDILLQKKAEGIKQVGELVRQNPKITRREISKITGFSFRTISRYLAELRKIYKKGIIKDQAEIQLEEKEARIVRLRKLIYQHPEWSKEKIASELGVAKITLEKYMKEL